MRDAGRGQAVVVPDAVVLGDDLLRLLDIPLRLEPVEYRVEQGHVVAAVGPGLELLGHFVSVFRGAPEGGRESASD